MSDGTSQPRQCLAALPSCRGWLAHQGTSPCPPTASGSGKHLLPSSPQGPLGLLFNTVCSTVVSRLEAFREVLQRKTQPWDKSHTLNNSCYSQSSAHRFEGGKEKKKGRVSVVKISSVLCALDFDKKVLLEMKIKSR